MNLVEARDRFNVARATRAGCLGDVDTARKALSDAEASLEPLDATAREAKADATAAKRKLKVAGDTAQTALADADPTIAGIAALEAFDTAFSHLHECNTAARKAVDAALVARASLTPLRDALEVAQQRLRTSETALREAADKLRSVIGGTVAGACGA